jgi:hypothetical protein
MSVVAGSGWSTNDWRAWTPYAQSTQGALGGGNPIPPPPGGGTAAPVTGSSAISTGSPAHAWLTLVGVLVAIRVLYHFAEA